MEGFLNLQFKNLRSIEFSTKISLSFYETLSFFRLSFCASVQKKAWTSTSSAMKLLKYNPASYRYDCGKCWHIWEKTNRAFETHLYGKETEWVQENPHSYDVVICWSNSHFAKVFSSKTLTRHALVKQTTTQHKHIQENNVIAVMSPVLWHHSYNIVFLHVCVLFCVKCIKGMKCESVFPWTCDVILSWQWCHYFWQWCNH